MQAKKVLPVIRGTQHPLSTSLPKGSRVSSRIPKPPHRTQKDLHPFLPRRRHCLLHCPQLPQDFWDHLPEFPLPPYLQGQHPRLPLSYRFHRPHGQKEQYWMLPKKIRKERPHPLSAYRKVRFRRCRIRPHTSP